jgi:uncharacterized protein DUF4386
MEAAAPAGRGSGLERWAGLGGVLYVVLFIVGAIVTYSGQPDTSDAPAKQIAWYSDSAHRDQINWGWALVMLGVFFLIWFLGALRQVMRRQDPTGFLTNVATIGGTVYAGTSLVGFSLNNAIKTMSDDTFHHQVYPALIHAADDAGYVIHASGGIGAGSLMIAGSLAARRAGAIPGWVGVLGIVAGFLGLFSVAFLPQFLVALWILIAGVLVFRASPAAPAVAT